MAERKGSCLCGAVGIRTHGDLRGVVFCHCSQCRRQTGLYYAATDVADEHLKVQGTENITWFRSSGEATRAFCKICGSALFWKQEGSAQTSIMAGLFDQPSGLEPARHIFVQDQADFYVLNDDLPKFAGSS